MQTKLFYGLAAAAALLGAIAHEFVGAPMVLGPLEGVGLPDDIVWLHHFSWHVGTVAVIAMVAMYWFALRGPNYRILAVIATGMAVGFMGLGIGLAVFGNSALWGTPAPYAWSVVSILGGVGLLVSRRDA